MLPKSKDEKNLTKFHMYISTHDAAGAIVLGVPHKQPRGAPRMTYGIWLLCQQDSRFFLPRPQQVARARRRPPRLEVDLHLALERRVLAASVATVLFTSFWALGYFGRGIVDAERTTLVKPNEGA